MTINAHHCFRCRVYYERGAHLECDAIAVKLTEFEAERLERIVESFSTMTRPFVITEEKFIRFGTPKKKPLVLSVPDHQFSRRQVATSLDGMETYAFCDVRPPGHRMTPKEIDAIYCASGKYGPTPSR